MAIDATLEHEPRPGHTGAAVAAPWRRDVAWLGGLILVAMLAFATSPLDGGYWWSDAPRHALNGAFLLDAAKALPVTHPFQYASEYYLHYPALTLMFYPPLVHVALALAYGVFGVSPAVAQAVVAAFHLGLLIAAYGLARRWLDRPYAFGAALVAGAGPELLRWSRQVMLDVPVYALMVAAAFWFVRWLDSNRPGALYAAVTFTVLAVYTKYNAGFILLPFALALVAARGTTWVPDRRVWTAALVAVVMLIPAVAMMLAFGSANLNSVLGSQASDLPRASLAAWTFYLQALPAQLGWPALVLAPVGAALAWRSRQVPRSHWLLLASWWLLGYAMLSYIALREERHSLITLLPLGVLAMYALQRAEPRIGRAAPVAAVALALGTTGWGLFATPAPVVEGHAEAARVVTGRAAPGENILFSGYRDGSFIFAMRGLGATQRTVRADKLLLRMFIARERGVEDRGFGPNDILRLIRKYGIRHVVAESDFWLDLPSLAALDRVLNDHTLFTPVARVPITSNAGPAARELVVYEYRGEVDDPPAPLSVEMVGLGRSLAAAR